MPVTRHTRGTLPHVTSEGQEEPVPLFDEVMVEHGPKDDGKPTSVLPDFTTKPYEPWLPAVEEQVEQEAVEKASQIADEALRHVRDELPPYEYTLDADAEDLDPAKYTLSWNKPPTDTPIKVKSERADRPSPTPRARRVQQ
jgi:hypothetical protein